MSDIIGLIVGMLLIMYLLFAVLKPEEF